MALKKKRMLLNQQLSRQFNDPFSIPIVPVSHHESVISGFRRELNENCSRPFFDTWPLKMGTIRCPETSVRSRHYQQVRNFPEECTSHLQHISCAWKSNALCLILKRICRIVQTKGEMSTLQGGVSVYELSTLSASVCISFLRKSNIRGITRFQYMVRLEITLK